MSLLVTKYIQSLFSVSVMKGARSQYNTKVYQHLICHGFRSGFPKFKNLLILKMLNCLLFFLLLSDYTIVTIL